MKWVTSLIFQSHLYRLTNKEVNELWVHYVGSDKVWLELVPPTGYKIRHQTKCGQGLNPVSVYT